MRFGGLFFVGTGPRMYVGNLYSRNTLLSGRSVAADPRLRVFLDLIDGDAHALPVRLPHPLVTACQRGKRDARRQKASGAQANFAPAAPALNTETK